MLNPSSFVDAGGRSSVVHDIMPAAIAPRSLQFREEQRAQQGYPRVMAVEHACRQGDRHGHEHRQTGQKERPADVEADERLQAAVEAGATRRMAYCRRGEVEG